MINFNDVLANPDKYKSKPITSLDQTIEVGMKVRCYDADSNDLLHFVGYGIVEEILDTNYAWCVSPGNQDQQALNYAFYVIPV